MADWWTRGTPLIRGQGELVAADFPSGGVASLVADASLLSSKFGPASVKSSNLGDAAVLSTQLSANALRRSVVVVTPDPAVGVAGLSSDYVLFRAPVPLTVTKVLMTPLVNWVVFSTSGEDAAVMFNANTSMAAVALSSAGGVTAAGVPKDFGALINASVAAGADIKFKLGIGGLADDPPAHSVQIDYVTTG